MLKKSLLLLAITLFCFIPACSKKDGESPDQAEDIPEKTQKNQEKHEVLGEIKVIATYYAGKNNTHAPADIGVFAIPVEGLANSIPFSLMNMEDSFYTEYMDLRGGNYIYEENGLAEMYLSPGRYDILIITKAAPQSLRDYNWLSEYFEEDTVEMISAMGMSKRKRVVVFPNETEIIAVHLTDNAR